MPLDSLKCNEIINALSLSDADERIIEAKRGFISETIAKTKLRSCGPYAIDFDCFKDVPENIKDALTKKDNIVIPYFDKDLNITKLKPHKYNLPNDELDLYCPWPLIYPESQKVWVLTEGEFKAIAAAQLGFNAVAVPGINTFTKKHLNKLLDFFRSVNPAGIIVVFDNEIKDDPKYDNYKKDYTKRYDSQLYAYVNAYKLSKEFPNVMICTLPIEYHIGGKVDIDGLLSKGISQSDFGLILSHSLTHEEYKRTWMKYPENHKSFLFRKIDKWFYNGPIIEQFNKYYIRKGSEKEEGESLGKPKLQEISNFVIKIINTVRTDGGNNDEVKRLVRIESNYGKSNPFILTSDIMSSKATFQKTLMSKGDYTFRGNESNLTDIWTYIFLSQSGLIIKSLNLFGLHRDTNMYVFGDGIYYKGNFYPVDDNSIVEVEENLYQIALSEDTSQLPVPVLEKTEPDFTIYDMFQRFIHISDEYFARMFLGWIFGHVFYIELTKNYGSWPQLFLDGAFGSGKSTLANIAMSILGMPNSKGVPLQGSTKVGMRNLATRYSGLPVHFEESRQNDDGTVQNNNFFRNLFDGGAVVKGSKKDGEIIAKSLTATCMVSGEEPPIDPATSSRFLILSLSKYTHKKNQNKESFEWIQKNKISLSYFTHSLLLRKDEIWPKVKMYVDEYIEGFEDLSDISTRNKMQHSIIAGIADAILGISDEFTSLVALKAKTAEGKNRAIQATEVFWDDIASLIKEHIIKDKYYVLEKDHEKVIAKVSFGSLYNLWEKHYKHLRKALPISREAILTNMRTEPYFYDYRRIRVGTDRPMGLVLRFSEDLPQGIINMIIHTEKKDGENITSLAQELIDKLDKKGEK